MQDTRNPNERNPRSAPGDNPAPLSDALHIPTLVDQDSDAAKGMAMRDDPATAREHDDPAPFSEALHIPTLVSEKSEKGKATLDRNDPAPFSKALHIPTLLGERSDERSKEPSTNMKNEGVGERDHNRATTPAGKPKGDAWSPIGVPSNHPQTEASDRLMKLDRVAVALAGLMTIGPLFAAMVGRMGY